MSTHSQWQQSIAKEKVPHTLSQGTHKKKMNPLNERVYFFINFIIILANTITYDQECHFGHCNCAFQCAPKWLFQRMNECLAELIHIGQSEWKHFSNRKILCPSRSTKPCRPVSSSCPAKSIICRVVPWSVRVLWRMERIESAHLQIQLTVPAKQLYPNWQRAQSEP